MKVLQCILAWWFLSGVPTWAHQPELDHGWHLEGDFQNRVGPGLAASSGIAISSGGNVGPYPTSASAVPSATYQQHEQTRRIQLVQSVIGYAAASVAGLASAPTILNQTGRQFLVEAVGYTAVPLADEVAEPAREPGQPWGIRFPGVVHPDTGNAVSGSNFSAERTVHAAANYRAALRVDPSNVQAALGLLRAYHERMVAWTFAGHNANERAARLRLETGDISAEIGVLEQGALPFYLKSLEELEQLFSRPLEASLLDGSYPYLANASLGANRNRLGDAYCRALSHAAETVLQIARLKHFRDYRNPRVDPEAVLMMAPVLRELDARLVLLSTRQLLLLPFPSLSPLASTELGRFRQLLDQIRLVRSAMADGRLTFIAAHNAGTPLEPNIQFVLRDYSPDYVPFHAVLEGKRSYEQFLAIAADFMGRAKERETDGQILVKNFNLTQSELVKTLHSLTNRYFQELGTLCGWIRTEEGALVPDLVLALLPPAERLQLHPYSGSGEGLGEVGAQWNRIETARREVEIAEQDLQSIYAEIGKKSEVADYIADGMDNLAKMFLENGEQLQKLDLEAGEIQAKATIDVAAASTRRSWLGSLARIGKLVGSAVIAAYTGGVSLGITAAAAAKTAVTALTSKEVVSEGINLASSWQQARNSRKAAAIQADAQRRLASIQAQRTRISTLERAAIQHQQRDQFLAQTAEALHSLLLRAERQKLAILNAEQRLDGELIALANLEGRVQFLLQEYSSALTLERENPLRSPDFRVVRDLRLREAEHAFLLAQQWLYLAAKSVEYRLNSASTQEGDMLRAMVASVLRARNSTTLDEAMAGLQDQLNRFHQGQNREASGIEPDALSFRHHLLQRNLLALTNELEIVSPEPSLPGTDSATEWRRFLDTRLIRRPNGVPDRLVIRFATSLDAWPLSSDPRFRNPLFNGSGHNELIASVSGFGQFHRGIEIRVDARALSIGGSPAVARLQYLGTSAVREESCTPIGGRRIRFWDIRRPDGQTYTADGLIGLNTWVNSGTSGFDEFSPANDLWQIEIVASRSSGNAILLNNLDRIEDVRIRFWTQYFPSSKECN